MRKEQSPKYSPKEAEITMKRAKADERLFQAGARIVPAENAGTILELTESQMREITKMDDEDTILKAISKNPAVFKFLSPKFKENKKFVLKALEKNDDIWPLVPADLQNDSDIKTASGAYRDEI